MRLGIYLGKTGRDTEIEGHPLVPGGSTRGAVRKFGKITKNAPFASAYAGCADIVRHMRTSPYSHGVHRGIVLVEEPTGIRDTVRMDFGMKCDASPDRTRRVTTRREQSDGFQVTRRLNATRRDAKGNIAGRTSDAKTVRVRDERTCENTRE